MKITMLLISLWGYLFIAGCGLQTAPVPMDVNSPTVIAIAADVERILDAQNKPSDTFDDILNVTVPIAASYGGWSGLAALVAWQVYQNRKKKK